MRVKILLLKILACGTIASGTLFMGAIQPAAADIPNVNPGPNCFGGAVSYGAQLNVFLYGVGPGYVNQFIFGFNQGEWQQHYRTQVCGQ
jgi:hypothetical protein